MHIHVKLRRLAFGGRQVEVQLEGAHGACGRQLHDDVAGVRRQPARGGREVLEFQQVGAGLDAPDTRIVLEYQGGVRADPAPAATLHVQVVEPGLPAERRACPFEGRAEMLVRQLRRPEFGTGTLGDRVLRRGGGFFPRRRRRRRCRDEVARHEIARNARQATVAGGGGQIAVHHAARRQLLRAPKRGAHRIQVQRIERQPGGPVVRPAAFVQFAHDERHREVGPQ